MAWSLVCFVFLRKARLSEFRRMSIWNDASFQVSLKLQSTSQPVSALVPGSYFDEAFYSGIVVVVMSGISTLLRNTRPEMFPSVAPQSWGHRSFSIRRFSPRKNWALILREFNNRPLAPKASDTILPSFLCCRWLGPV